MMQIYHPIGVMTFLSRPIRINCIAKKDPRLFTTCFYLFDVKNLQDVKTEEINKYTAFCDGIFASQMVSMQVILRFLVIYRQPGSVSETKEKQYSAVPVAEAETIQVLIP